MNVSLRLYRALQALVLAALGLFLFNKIWSGTLFWYINQRFVILTVFAAVVFMILGEAVLSELRRSPGRAASSESRKPWPLLVMTLPVALGLLIPPQPLGASAVANRGLNPLSPLSVNNSGAVQLALAPANRTILDWQRAADQPGGSANLEGQVADVTGFVYHDARLPPDRFFVSRFVLTCCVVDATPVAMLVVWPGAQSLPNDAWVRVRGPVNQAEYDGGPVLLVEAWNVDPAAEPPEPYLYP
jgi:putative membrane protein